MTLWREWLRQRAVRRSRRRLESLVLTPADLAIDCGANVGSVTEIFARGGATVYAFEPNPHAFKVLQARFAGRPQVRCLQQGVLDRPGRLKLYLHEWSDQNEVMWSTGSSLLEFKSNVLQDKYVEVELVDLDEFIRGLARPVKVLKLDVEGVECAVVGKLIDRGTLALIEHLFVETHDHKVPELRAETDALRARIKRQRISNIYLDWI